MRPMHSYHHCAKGANDEDARAVFASARDLFQTYYFNDANLLANAATLFCNNYFSSGEASPIISVISFDNSDK